MRAILTGILLCAITALGAPIQQQHAVVAKKMAAAGGDPTLIQHLDASTIAGSDTDPITTWTATVGKNATNAGGGVRPTLQTAEKNGLSVLRFDGSDDTMATAAFDVAITQPFCVFIVIKNNDDSVLQRVLSDIVDGGGNRCIVRTGALWSVYAGSGFQSLDTATESWCILSVEVNGASTKYRINGGAETAAGDPGSTGGFTGLRISGDYDGTINPATVDIAEIRIHSGAIADKSAIFTALNAKWAVY